MRSGVDAGVENQTSNDAVRQPRPPNLLALFELHDSAESERTESKNDMWFIRYIDLALDFVILLAD